MYELLAMTHYNNNIHSSDAVLANETSASTRVLLKPFSGKRFSLMMKNVENKKIHRIKLRFDKLPNHCNSIIALRISDDSSAYRSITMFIIFKRVLGYGWYANIRVANGEMQTAFDFTIPNLEKLYAMQSIRSWN